MYVAESHEINTFTTEIVNLSKDLGCYAKFPSLRTLALAFRSALWLRALSFISPTNLPILDFIVSEDDIRDTPLSVEMLAGRFVVAGVPSGATLPTWGDSIDTPCCGAEAGR